MSIVHLVEHGVRLLSAYDDWWGRNLTLEQQIDLLLEVTASPQVPASTRWLLAQKIRTSRNTEDPEGATKAAP